MGMRRSPTPRAGRGAPGVLAAAAAELAGRDRTVAATEAELAAVAQARVAGLVRARGARAGTVTPAGAPMAGNSVGRAVQAAFDALRRRSAGEEGRRSDVLPEVADAPRTGAGAPLRSARGADSADAPRTGAGAPPGSTHGADSAAPPRSDPGPGTGAGAGPDKDVERAAGIVGGRPGPGMPRRVFFPRGSAVTTWTEPERRAPLPTAAIDSVRTLVDDELARRAACLDRFDVAVLDAALARVPAPMRERAASGQFAGWPRGSIRALPGASVLRLFLHWQDTATSRVDLDLSCVFFDTNWRRRGYCDYTQLRFASDGAVHSGDLTSAPAPLGATEFLDLRLPRLAERGVRYLVPVVLSYNAVPFELLTEAFAGLMLPLDGGAQFDAARVEQRFDLRGDARMLLPMVVDLRDRQLLWTDLALPGRGYGHSVDRATLLDLMAWQAAGRADRVLVAHPDGTCTEVPPSVAAIRAAAGAGTGELAAVDGVDGRTVLAATVDGEALDRLVPGPVAAGSVALTVTGHPGEPWTRLHAPEALGQLAPATR